MKFVTSAILAVVIGFLLGTNKPQYWTLDGSLHSPTGSSVFLFGVTTVNPTQLSLTGPSYQSKDIGPQWAAKTAQRIREYGFNAAGAWSDPSLDPYIPHTRCLSLYHSTTVPISSPQWEKQIETIIRSSVSPNDQNLIGYYLDNELDWNALEPEAPKYFEVIHRLLKRYDPHHLILGVRFNKLPPVSVLEASKGKVDVHSFNTYADEPATVLYNFVHRTTGVPIIISEFSFYADENRSQNMNSKGFGGHTLNQKDRAEHLKHYLSLLPKCVIGIEWFQWNDEPPQGRIKDGEDCNFGIVDITDTPYREIVNTIKSCGGLLK